MSDVFEDESEKQITMLNKICEANTFFEIINQYKEFFDLYNKFKSKDGLALDNKVINELGKLQKKMEEKHAKSDKPLEIADIHKSYVLTAHIIKEFIDDMFLIEEKVLNGSSFLKNNVLKRKSKFYKVVEEMLDTQEYILESEKKYKEKILLYYVLAQKKREFLILIIKHSLNLMRGNSKALLESLYAEETHPIKKGKIGLIEEEATYTH